MAETAEIWRYIQGSDNCYVSTFGKVKQVVNGEDVFLKFSPDIKGYMRVTIRMRDENGKRSKGQRVKVHRLVAETFIPRIEGKDYINHIDCNKANNRVDNLEWCTPKGNAVHASEHGLLKKTYGPRKIVAVDLVSHLGFEFDSITEAAQKLDIGVDDIHNCLQGRTVQADGMVFGFYDKNGEVYRYRNNRDKKKVKEQLIKAKQNNYEIGNKRALNNTKRKVDRDA